MTMIKSVILIIAGLIATTAFAYVDLQAMQQRINEITARQAAKRQQNEVLRQQAQHEKQSQIEQWYTRVQQMSKAELEGEKTRIDGAIEDLERLYEERKIDLINDTNRRRSRTSSKRQLHSLESNIRTLRQMRDVVSQLLTGASEAARVASTCPFCKAALATGAKFCSSCGGKLSSECPNCKKPAFGKFCAECGTKLNQ